MNDIQRRRTVARQVAGGTPAAERLLGCGQTRDHRGDLKRCNRPPCPDCGRISGNRFARRCVQPLAEVAEACGFTAYFATLILQPSAYIEQAGQHLQCAKRQTKDGLHRLAVEHPALEGWWMTGGFEMGVARDNEFHLLEPGMQGTLEELGFPHGTCGGPVWLPHLHLLLALPPGCDVALVRRALAKLFPARRQLHVRRLNNEGFNREDVQAITRYPFKHQLRLAGPRGAPVRSWDAEEVTIYARWAEGLSSHGYRGLRFTSGEGRFLRIVEAALDAEWQAEQESMAAEDEYLHGPCTGVGGGGGSPDGQDEVLPVVLTQRDGETTASSSNGGVYTTRSGTFPSGGLGEHRGSRGAAQWAHSMASADPTQHPACRGPPLRGG